MAERSDDLITLAARRGLLDEPTARAVLGTRAVEPDVLIESGILTPEQVGDLLGRNDPTVMQTPSALITASDSGTIPHEASKAAEDPARRFGRYVLVEKIGEGGMGAVWKAWQTDLRRWVAIKFVRGESAEEVARFVREAQMAAKLSHPNIVATHEAGEEGGRHYIAMDYIEGDDLKKLRLEPRRALEVVKEAAEAVQYAHEQGIIHRDLKPHNLMVTRRGRLYVMDFGLAKSTEAPSGLSMSGSFVGTP